MSEHVSLTEREPSPAPAESASQASNPPRMLAVPSRLRRDAMFLVIAVAVVVLDQVTKHLVRENLSPGEVWPDPDWLLNIVHVSNSGAAFGILQGQTLFLVVTSLIGVAAILLYYFYPPLEHGVLMLALGLQLGGAAGNLIDRVRFGRVTDFINFEFWPAFNVADACISIGVVTIVAFFLTVEGDRLRRPPRPGSPGG